MSTDCWCEPTAIQWVTNKHGVQVLVIEHCDNTLVHHIVLAATRERDKNVVPPAGTNWGLDSPWITRMLDLEPPKLLPPHDPNERRI